MEKTTPSTQGLSNQIKGKWSWFMIIGIILIVLGLLALSYQFMATVFSVYYIGILLAIAGIAQIVQSLKIKSFGQTALWGLIGIIYLITGILALYQPIAVSSVLTLLIAILLIVGGISQILGALNNRLLPNWGWLLVSGIITLLLGVIILAGWPVDSLWILGMFLGIDLLFQGWAYVMISMTLKAAK